MANTVKCLYIVSMIGLVPEVISHYAVHSTFWVPCLTGDFH
jgi:hypothetical protein